MEINYPMKVIGAGRDKTTIRGGGFKIQGVKEEGKHVALKEMTLQEASGNGLESKGGLSFLCDSMTFTQCGHRGVWAANTKGRLINCVFTQCGRSGIFCFTNALIELEGDQTKVDRNVTSGGPGYGLWTFDTSSRIHLLCPLTKESVSTNNQGGGNYGGPGGMIETVDAFE